MLLTIYHHSFVNYPQILTRATRFAHLAITTIGIILAHPPREDHSCRPRVSDSAISSIVLRTGKLFGWLEGTTSRLRQSGPTPPAICTLHQARCDMPDRSAMARTVRCCRRQPGWGWPDG